MDEKIKELLKEEGKDADTSPAQLNNDAVPTAEEEASAGIEPVEAPEDVPSPEEEHASSPEEEVPTHEDDVKEAEDADTNADDINADADTDDDTDITSPVLEQEQEQEQEQVSEETPVPEEEPANGPIEAPATGTFTQSQVDELIGKTRKEARDRFTKNLFSRYGVNSEEELDDMFGDSQRFVTLSEEYKTYKSEQDALAKQRDAELADLKEKIALLESGIDKERYDDAKFILRGKGLDVTAENIANELVTHPEWKHVAAPKTENSHFVKKEEAPSTLKILGNEGQTKPQELSERDEALALFGKF